MELLGSVLFSLVEPRRGREVAFHRWYERDHFYAGVMAGPFAFSGRRWVATRSLKSLRYPRHPDRTPIADDIALGSYLHTYWILAGHHDEFVAWAVAAYDELKAAGRMFGDVSQIFTGFFEYSWAVSRDPDGVPPSLALEHPYAGIGTLMVERPEGPQSDSGADDALERWLRDEHLPAALSGSGAGLCLALRPYPLPESVAQNVPHTPGMERRILLLYFLENDPRECWESVLQSARAGLADGRHGAIVYAAPFIPTVPGSDRYSDDLW